MFILILLTQIKNLLVCSSCFDIYSAYMVCIILISTTGTEKRFVFPVFRIEVLTDWTYLAGEIRNNFQEIIAFPV